MGKLDVERLVDLSPEDFKMLQALERLMVKHELVSGDLVALTAHCSRGACHNSLEGLRNLELVAFDTIKNQRYQGYRLTRSGYDFLAINELRKRNITSFGHQIGTGKESDVYIVGGNEENELALKLHRLGRTSFRQLKNKRDYHKNKSGLSWLQLSRISAAKEFACMKALHSHGFPIPKPVAHNRNAVVMELISGYPLHMVHELEDPAYVYSQCMELIVQLAEVGLIHSDFNEFNLMLDDNDRIIVIDFPQMVSTSHENADMYFDRDVKCIRDFFYKKFSFESEELPAFGDIEKVKSLDLEVYASGYSKEEKKEQKRRALGKERARQSDEEEEEEDDAVKSEQEEEEDDTSKLLSADKGGEDDQDTTRGQAESPLTQENDDSTRGRSSGYERDFVQLNLGGRHQGDSGEGSGAEKRVREDGDAGSDSDEMVPDDCSRADQESDSSDSDCQQGAAAPRAHRTRQEQDMNSRIKSQAKRKAAREAARRITKKGNSYFVTRKRRENAHEIKSFMKGC